MKSEASRSRGRSVPAQHRVVDRPADSTAQAFQPQNLPRGDVGQVDLRPEVAQQLHVLLREAVRIDLDQHVLEPRLRAQQAQRLGRLLRQQVDLRLFDRDVVYTLSRHVANQLAEHVQAHRLLRILAAELVDYGDAATLEALDLACSLVFAQSHVILGNLERRQAEALQQSHQI